MANVFKRASAIYKKHPSKKWSACVKEAAREVKGKSKVGYATYTRKKIKQVTRTARKKKKHFGLTNRAAVRSVKIGNIPAYLRAGARAIAEKIGWYEASKITAKTAKSKKAIQKKINELKVQFRKLL